MMDTQRRDRKKNFSDDELRILIEEVSLEGGWLMSKNNNKITNKKKETKWRQIAEKMTALGIAVRTWQDAREKFKKMRADVINRQRDMTKTGGGKPPPPAPFEESILQIIGAESNLISGIHGGK